MNTIVTHAYPDLDAISSSWLVRKFYPGFADAEITFVSAGKTLNEAPPDENPEIIHVDTGFGRFDHHQTDEYTCAAKRVFEYLRDNDHIPHNLVTALERMVKYINTIDHFAEVYYEDATDDKYDFGLASIIDGLHNTIHIDAEVVTITFKLLEAELQLFRNKVRAEQELQKGYNFTTRWGKSLAMETRNEEAVKIALKSGYSFVVRKDPVKGFVRVKTLPDKQYDLTPLYDAFLAKEPKATWFLHVSKNMLLNGSAKNPSAIPSILTLPQLIEIIKKIA